MMKKLFDFALDAVVIISLVVLVVFGFVLIWETLSATDIPFWVDYWVTNGGA